MDIVQSWKIRKWRYGGPCYLNIHYAGLCSYEAVEGIKSCQVCLYSKIVSSEVLTTQSCRTLCDLMDCSPRGSFVHGILQARILEWVEPFRSPGAVPDPGIEPGSPVLQVDSLPLEPPGNRYRTHQDTEDARRAVQAV